MRTVISGFAMLFALTGCATFGFTPVKDPTVRIEAYGFSILPPPGTGWSRRPDLHLKGSDLVVFSKNGGSKTHTIGISVGRHTGFNPAAVGFAEYATNPEVFASYVKNSIQHANPPEGRTRIIELSVVPDTKSGHCVREYAKFEDHGSLFFYSSLPDRDQVFKNWDNARAKLTCRALFPVLTIQRLSNRQSPKTFDKAGVAKIVSRAWR